MDLIKKQNEDNDFQNDSIFEHSEELQETIPEEAEYSYNDEISDEVEEFAEELKPKKFVFKIYPENIEYIESIDRDDRNDIINSIINDYIHHEHKLLGATNSKEKFKKIVIGILVALIGIPIAMMMINASLHSTQNSYGEMQSNFQDLYKSRGR